jgi:hypothetical protein
VASRYPLRASDSDREEVVERLRAGAAEGRLLIGELEKRLEVAFRARTYGELDALVVDLPTASAPPPARRRPGLPVLAGATLALGVLLSVLATAATTGFARLHSAAGAGPSTSVHRQLGGLHDAGPVGLLGAMAPLIVIVFLVAVCAALGWLFSQNSGSPHAAPEA